MIYTVTLNPALDRILEVENLVPDDANRVVAESRWAGGKGIDCSRVIRELGGVSVALGFVGGFDGLELEGRLINEGVLTRFTRTANETRINVYVRNRTSGTQTALNSPGPEIRPGEVAELYNQVRSLSDATHVMLSGSVPTGVNKGLYAQLIMALKEKKAFVALDTDGTALTEGVKAGPDLIKPNVHEFQRLTGKPAGAREEMVKIAREQTEKGVGSLLITLGREGMIYVPREGKAFFAKAPPVQAISTIGAGDSTLAGFVLGLSRGLAPQECLRLAAAAGTATAMTPGVELCRKADVERLLPGVEVAELAG